MNFLQKRKKNNLLADRYNQEAIQLNRLQLVEQKLKIKACRARYELEKKRHSRDIGVV
jgi:hypothetical protein